MRAFLILLAAASPAIAQEPAPRPKLGIDLSGAVDPASPAAPAEPAPVPESAQPFAAHFYLTHDDAAFRAAWSKDASPVGLPTTRSISLASPVFGMLAVSGCRPRDDRKCDLSISWRTSGPDGVFDAPRAAGSWRPQPGTQPALATASMQLALERSDPPGRYTIEATVTDVISGQSLVLAASATKPESETPAR